jgi:hypothetical protein
LLYSYGACLIDKKIIPRLGWFDERFLGGNREDQDMHLRVLLKEGTEDAIKHTNTWHQTANKSIKHEAFYYSSACWDGHQNERYFKEKWGSTDYTNLCELAKNKQIKPKFEDVDWYPSYTGKFRNL